MICHVDSESFTPFPGPRSSRWHDHPIAHAVNHWPVTAQACIQPQASPCGNWGELTFTATGFPPRLQFSSQYHSTNVPFSFVRLLPVQYNLHTASLTHWKNRLPGKQGCRTNRFWCTPFFSIPCKYEQVVKSHELGKVISSSWYSILWKRCLLCSMCYHTMLVQPLFLQWHISSRTESWRPKGSSLWFAVHRNSHHHVLLFDNRPTALWPEVAQNTINSPL